MITDLGAAGLDSEACGKDLHKVPRVFLRTGLRPREFQFKKRNAAGISNPAAPI